MLTEEEIEEFKYLAKEYDELDNILDYDDFGVVVYNEDLYYELLALEGQIDTNSKQSEEYILSEVNNVIQISNKWR